MNERFSVANLKALPPVFVLGHGITQLGVIRALGAAGITAYSISDQPDFVAYSRYFKKLPGCSESPKPERLIELLRAASVERAVLMPCTDDWAIAVVSLPPDVAQRFPSSMPPRLLVEDLLDKWRLAELLEREAIPHPRTVCIRSLPEAEAIREESYVGAFLKPRASIQFSKHYRVKAFAAENRDEALRQLEKIFADGLSIVLQEYIPGPATEHYFLDGFVDRKGKASILGRQRLRMNPPRFGNSCFMVSVPLDKVRTAADSLETLFTRTKFRGMFDAEFKYDPRDSQFKLIEINCRPWWQLDFAEHCGIPVCEMAYRDALGYDVPQLSDYKVGRRGVILSQDFQAYRALSATGQMGLWSWLSSWLGAHDLVFRWDDPMPAMAQAVLSVRKARRGRNHRAPA